jgi:hypothetical protein
MSFERGSRMGFRATDVAAVFLVSIFTTLACGNHSALASSSFSCNEAHSFIAQLNDAKNHFLEVQKRLPLVSSLLEQRSQAPSHKAFNQKNAELARLLNLLFDQIVIGKDELKETMSLQGRSSSDIGRLVSRTYGALEVELSEILNLSEKNLQRILSRRHVLLSVTSPHNPIGFVWSLGPASEPSEKFAPDMTTTRPPFENAYGRIQFDLSAPETGVKPPKEISEEQMGPPRHFRLGFPITDEKNIDDPLRMNLAIDANGDFVLINSQFRHPGHNGDGQ